VRRRALGRRGHETVRRLLAAGLAEIDEHGFHAMRVDDVARLADISHGTFYLYFSSKEDLLAELLREAQRDIVPGSHCRARRWSTGSPP
jgi:AcrR family transcriptional regulator